MRIRMSLHDQVTKESPNRRARRWRKFTLERLESRRLLAASVTETPIRSVGGPASYIASDPHGDLWFTSQSTTRVTSTNNIGVLDPTTKTVVHQYPIPTINAGAGAITRGSDGNFWFVETTANQIGTINSLTGAVSEFPLLATPNAGLQDITSGPDGKIWFTESNANQIGSIDPKTHVISELQVPNSLAIPYGITSDPKDDTLWFTEAGTNDLGFINPVTHQIVDNLLIPTSDAEAEGITYDPQDGKIWFAEVQANKIGSINSTTHQFDAAISKGISAGAQFGGMTLDNSGNVWVTEIANGKAARINVSTRTVSEIALGSFFSTFGTPLSIASGSDGNLWVPGSGQIASITPAVSANAPVVIPGTSAGTGTAMTTGVNGALWFTLPGDSEFGTIDPTSQITKVFPVSSRFTPQGITVNPNDGTIWFTEDSPFTIGGSGPSMIGIVNPTTDALQEVTIPNGDTYPLGITFDPKDGNFWFTENNANKIARLDPAQGNSISDNVVLPANSKPNGIVPDAKGNLWFTESGTGYAGMLVPTSNVPVQIKLSSAGSNPDGIAFDSDTNTIWVAELNASMIEVIDAATQKIIHQIPAANNGAITIGPDKNVWITESGALAAIDPSTYKITATYATPNANPLGITAGKDGNLWFTGAGNPNVVGAVVLSPASTADHLAVTTQTPSDVTAGKGFGLVVAVENNSNNVDTFYNAINGSVTIALTPQNGATLSGTLTAPVVNGQAVFSGLNMDIAGSGYTIQASFGGLSTIDTNSFTVTLPATRLVATTQPPASVADLTPFEVDFSAEDANGNVDTSYNGPVTLDLTNNIAGATLNSATLGTSLTLGAVNGTASFPGLTLNKIANDFTITATSGTLSPTTTTPLNVIPGAATQLILTSQPPASFVAGTPFSLAVSAEDVFGNVDTSFNSTLVAALVNPAGGAVLTGTVTETAGKGTATFPALTVDEVGKGYTLQISGGGLKSLLTSSFTVTSGTASQLVVTTSPVSPVYAGRAFDMKVTAEDQFGNLDPTYSGTLTAALVSNPGGDTLGGSITATASSGVADFFGLVLTKAAKGYMLEATATGAGPTPVPSASFSVAAATASQLVLTTAPPASVAAHGNLPLVVDAEDPFGNINQSFTGAVTASLGSSPAGATLGGTAVVNAVAGVATFSGLFVNQAGTGYTLQAGADALSSVTSNTFEVTAEAVATLAISAPAKIVAGKPFELIVSAVDSYGNVDPTFTGSLAVSLGNNPDGASLGGTTTLNAVAGVADFKSLSLDKPGAGFTLQAAAAGLPTAATNAFNVSSAIPAVAVFQPGTSTFYIQGVGATQFGQGSNFGGDPIPFITDYAGTGKPQLVVFQPSSSTFFIQGAGVFQFGQGSAFGGDPIPFVADVAGTGKPQLIVFQPSTSTFYVRGTGVFQFGQGSAFGGDPIPFVADVAGTGKPQLIVYQPSTSTFYVRGTGVYQFGQGSAFGGDPQPIVADVSGTTQSQLIVYQPSTSTFYVQGVGAFQFGQGSAFGGDPVGYAGDYNNDGKADLTVFQPSSSTFYVRGVGAYQLGQGIADGGNPIPVVYGSDGPLLSSAESPSIGIESLTGGPGGSNANRLVGLSSAINGATRVSAPPRNVAGQGRSATISSVTDLLATSPPAQSVGSAEIVIPGTLSVGASVDPARRHALIDEILGILGDNR